VNATGEQRLVPASIVGVAGEQVEVVVEPRLAANFAAALGSELAAYLDDRDAGALRAPPTLACALTVPASRSVGEAILKATGLPVSAFHQQLHYSEVLQFDRPIEPGMRLRVQGSLAALRPHRLGTEFVVAYEATCEGMPVFREFLGSLARGLNLEGGVPVNAIVVPEVRSQREPSTEEEPVFGATRMIERRDPYLYDAASGISFPLHTSRRFAASVGSPDVVLHGTAVLGMAVELLVQRILGRPDGVREIACRFGGMVAPGSIVTFEARRGAPGFRLAVRDQAGTDVLRGCTITVD
jgi:acyl dehydratase